MLDEKKKKIRNLTDRKMFQIGFSSSLFFRCEIHLSSVAPHASKLVSTFVSRLKLFCNSNFALEQRWCIDMEASGFNYSSKGWEGGVGVEMLVILTAGVIHWILSFSELSQLHRIIINWKQIAQIISIFRNRVTAKSLLRSLSVLCDLFEGLCRETLKPP